MKDTPLAIATKYFTHWTNGNIEDAGKLIAKDAKFDTPINEYATKDAFMAAVAFTAQNSSDITMLASLGNEHEAILMYEFTFAPVGKLIIAEHFTIYSGRINFIRHVHDTYKLRMLMQ